MSQEQCSACAAPLPAGSAFCTRCGTAAVREIDVQVRGSAQWGAPEDSRRQRRSRAREDGAGRATSASAAPGGAGGLREIQPDGALLTEERWREVRSAAVPSHPAHEVLGPAFDGAVPAVVGRRLAAFALDTLAVLLVGAAAWWLTSSWLVGVLLALEVAAGLVVWEARSGRTIGGSLLGLRAAQDEQPLAPGLGRALVRATLLGGAHLLFGLGQWLVVASSAWDRSGRGQGWHDRLAGTLVVDVRGLRSRSTVPAPESAAERREPLAAAPSVPGAQVPGVPAPTPPVPTPPVPTPPASAPAVSSLPVPPSPEAARPPAPLAVQPSDAPAAVTLPQTRAAYVLTVDDGRSVTVLGPGVVGRRPQPPEGEPCEHVLTVEDPGRSLSRTHARFGLDGDAFWVEDLGSANGTAVAAADGTWSEALAHERVVVPDGGTLRLGDRTVSVRRSVTHT